MLIHNPEISRLAAYGVKALPIGEVALRNFNNALYSTIDEQELPAFAQARLNEIRQAIKDENAAIEAARLAS